MRKILLTAAALLALNLPAHAAIYALTDAAGDRQCISYDGAAHYTIPAGWTLTVMPNCTPIDANPPPHSNLVPVADILAVRFTPAEFSSLITLCLTDATAHGGLVKWLSKGVIDLTDPAFKAALDYLVSKSVITSARETAILTP